LITGYRLGEGFVEHKDRVAVSQKMVGTGIFYPKTPRTGFFRLRMILRTSAARPCRSSGCDPPPSSVASSLAPKGDLKLAGLAIASERRALALLPNCPPVAPTPSSHRSSVRTHLRQKQFANVAPTPSLEECLRVFGREKDISDWPSGRSLCRCTDIMLFLNPRAWLPDSC
jgi:hypothetical protein